MTLDFPIDRPDRWNCGHPYHERELWFALSLALPEWGREFHHLLLHDKVRMAAFREAIEGASDVLVGEYLSKPDEDREPIRILDVGTGSGVLSAMMATAIRASLERRGALDASWRECVRIYAVDFNPEALRLARSNLKRLELLHKDEGSGGPVLLFAGDCKALHAYLSSGQKIPFDPAMRIPSSFDLIMSETIGGLGDNEDGPAIIVDARQLLGRPQCRMIPEEIRTFVAPVASVPDRFGHCLWDQVRAVPARGCKTIAQSFVGVRHPDPFNRYYDAIIPADDLVADPKLLAEWKLEKIDSSARILDDYDVNLDFPAVRSSESRLIGFRVHFEAILFSRASAGSPVVLTNEGHVVGVDTSDCWKHTFLPIQNAVIVGGGESIEFSYARLRTDNQDFSEALTYTWSGRVAEEHSSETNRGSGVGDRTFRQQCVGPAARESSAVGSEQPIPGPAASWKDHLRLYARKKLLGFSARLSKTSEFLLNVGLGLIIGSLFTSATKGRVIGLEGEQVKGFEYSIPDRFLMAAIGLTLVRLLHSFFLLYGDSVYKRFVRSRRSLGWAQSVVQVAFVSGCLYFLVESHPSNSKIMWWGILLFPALLLWDIPVAWEFRKMVKRGVSNRRQRLLRDTFQEWVLVDVVGVLVLLIFVFLEGAASMSGSATTFDKPTAELLVAAGLCVIAFYDYIKNNRFYFQEG